MARLKEEEISRLVKELNKYFKSEALFGKGGFFIKGKGFITLPQARKITGLKGKPRVKREVSGGYGEYATLRKIVGRM